MKPVPPRTRMRSGFGVAAAAAPPAPALRVAHEASTPADERPASSAPLAAAPVFRNSRLVGIGTSHGQRGRGRGVAHSLPPRARSGNGRRRQGVGRGAPVPVQHRERVRRRNRGTHLHDYRAATMSDGSATTDFPRDPPRSRGNDAAHRLGRWWPAGPRALVTVATALYAAMAAAQLLAARLLPTGDAARDAMRVRQDVALLALWALATPAIVRLARRY